MASNHRGGSGIQIGSAWFQRKINLRPQHRGVHLVTEEILRQMPELNQFSVGLCHVQSECTLYIYILYTFFLFLFSTRLWKFLTNINLKNPCSECSFPFESSVCRHKLIKCLLLSINRRKTRKFQEITTNPFTSSFLLSLVINTHTRK